MDLPEEVKATRDLVRKLARTYIAPRASEIDSTGTFPWDIKEILANHDVLGIWVPEELGGMGGDLLSLCMAVEEVARVCVSSSLIIQVQALAASAILMAGSDEQKKRYVPPLATGEKLGAFALTEPGAGSDASAIATVAEKIGDAYYLSGTKCFISNGPVADIVVVFAMTEPDRGVRGITAFIVEKGWPGFSVGKLESKMGIRGSPTSELIFDRCPVPASNRIGQEGDGFKIAMRCLDHSRPVIAAQAVGLAQGALDFACQYAKKRVQFGSPIANLQGIQFMLAEMAARVEAARWLAYRAAWAVERGLPEASFLAACSKLVASEAAMRVTTDAVQVCGGYGYTTEFGVERMMRDAKITEIYEGTNQIQKVVMARYLLR